MNRTSNNFPKLFTDLEVESDNCFYYADITYNKKKDEYNILINSNNYKTYLNEEKSTKFHNKYLNNNNIYTDDNINKWIKDKKKRKENSVISIRNKNTKTKVLKNNIHFFEKQLISASVMIFFKKKLLVLKRDEKAPVDKNKYQFPGGRASNTPSITSTTEFFEEIKIENKEKNKIFNNMDDINAKKSNLNKTIVKTYINDVLIEEENFLVEHDINNNTLEMFKVFETNNDFNDFIFSDNENFGRKVEVMSLFNFNKSNKNKFVTYIQKMIDEDIFIEINNKINNDLKNELNI